MAESIQVSGCIYQGVECLVLKNVEGRQNYSIARTDKLQVGHAYSIKGTVQATGICQEGLPILAPETITEIRLKCPPPLEAGDEEKEFTGYSDKLSFDEAFAAAVDQIPPSNIIFVRVTEIGGEFGGFTGASRMSVKVKRVKV